MVNMKKFLRKLGEMAALAIVPIVIDAIVDLLVDLKKKVEAEIEEK